MGGRHEIAAHRYVPGDVPVRIEETLHFANRPDVRQCKQSRDVAQSLLRRQRRGEYARVGGDAQV